MVFDRAEILRSAHRMTRERMTPSSSWRHGDRYDPEVCGWVPKFTYRKCFAGALRAAWRDAKYAAEEAAYEASLPPIPADIADRIRELQAEAWAERIDGPGNARHAALLAQARDLGDAARGLL